MEQSVNILVLIVTRVKALEIRNQLIFRLGIVDFYFNENYLGSGEIL